jgi:hypothetical protein
VITQPVTVIQPTVVAPATAPLSVPVATAPAPTVPVNSLPTASQTLALAAQNPTLANALSTSALLTTPMTPSSTLPRTGVSQIIDNTVLNRLNAGDTAGFINALSGNVQNSLNTSSQLFFQLTG